MSVCDVVKQELLLGGKKVGSRYTFSSRLTKDTLEIVDFAPELEDLMHSFLSESPSTKYFKGIPIEGSVNKRGYYSTDAVDCIDEVTCIEDIQRHLNTILFEGRKWRYYVELTGGGVGEEDGLYTEESFVTDDQMQAIVKWLHYQATNPAMGSISSYSKNNCMDLYKCFIKEYETICKIANVIEMESGKKFPLKLERVLKVCKEKISPDCKHFGFIEHAEHYDMIYPFDIG